MAATVSLGCAVALSACTSGYIDSSDPCNANRKPFVDAKTDFASWTIGGSVVGLIVGVGAGLLVGGKAKHALIAGSAGALIGAGAGYLVAKQRQASNRAELLTLIDGDADSDGRRIDRLTLLVEDLGNCRIRQSKGIEQRARQGQIDRGEAKAQLAEVDELILQDDEVISDVLGKAEDRLAAYIDAKSQLTNRLRSLPTPPSRPSVNAQIEVRPGKYIVVRRAHLRSRPSSSSESLDVFEPNSEIYVTGQTTDDQWYAVVNEGGPAFILAARVRPIFGRDPVTVLASSGRRLAEQQKLTKDKEMIERQQQMLEQDSVRPLSGRDSAAVLASRHRLLAEQREAAE
jgi:hypothetical protein